MTRLQFIERVRRQIYNGMPNDDSTITIGLVNNYLNDSIAIAAKTNYKDNISIDGINFVNNSFYTVFKNIDVIKDEQFVWKIELPQIPVGIGYTEGISRLQFKDSATGQISQPVIFLSENQMTYYQNMRPIPNRILAYPQGKFIYALSTILLSQYTASVTMISGGDSTDLDSELNVPPDYFPTMMAYLQQQLLLEKTQPLDNQNDGEDFTITT